MSAADRADRGSARARPGRGALRRLLSLVPLLAAVLVALAIAGPAAAEEPHALDRRTFDKPPECRQLYRRGVGNLFRRHNTCSVTSCQRTSTKTRTAGKFVTATKRVKRTTTKTVVRLQVTKVTQAIITGIKTTIGMDPTGLASQATYVVQSTSTVWQSGSTKTRTLTANTDLPGSTASTTLTPTTTRFVTASVVVSCPQTNLTDAARARRRIGAPAAGMLSAGALEVEDQIYELPGVAIDMGASKPGPRQLVRRDLEPEEIFDTPDATEIDEEEDADHLLDLERRTNWGNCAVMCTTWKSQCWRTRWTTRTYRRTSTKLVLSTRRTTTTRTTTRVVQLAGTGGCQVPTHVASVDCVWQDSTGNGTFSAVFSTTIVTQTSTRPPTVRTVFAHDPESDVGPTLTTTLTAAGTVSWVATSPTFTGDSCIPMFIPASQGLLKDSVGALLTIVERNVVTAQGFPVQINANGSFIYTPSTGFSGTDSFSYTVIDANGVRTSSVATLAMTSCIAPPPPAPPAPAQLGGRVYIDANRNGVDDNEIAITGVTINLVGTDSAGFLINRTTTTGPDGTYLFTNLPPGTYSVFEIQPAVYQNSPLGPQTEILNIALKAGDSKLDNDFGEIQIIGEIQMTTSTLSPSTSTRARTSSTFTVRAELGGRVYVDANLNGMDDGETAIPGVTVNLVGTDDLGNPVSLTTTTGPDGTYLFPNLRPGTYSVFEIQPAGFTNSPLGPQTEILNVVLVNGDSKLDNDFGEIQMTTSTLSPSTSTRARTSSTFTVRAELGGRVYVDANLNGMDDGETAIPGVTVNLVGTDDLGNPVSLTTTTGPDGTYLFPNLRPGTYSVFEIQPAGFTNSPLGPQTEILNVVLVNGDSKLDNDFGEIQMTTSTLSPSTSTRARTSSTFTVRAELGGRVYVDANLNGMDDGETAIPGVTVNLVGTDDLGNPVSLTTTTGPDGTYLFPNLRPGTYSVFEIQPAGFTNSPLGPQTEILNVVLVNGDSKLDNDFGEIQMTTSTLSPSTSTRARTSSTFTVRAELGGRVYVDANLNGVDDGETAIPGVTVNLVGTDDLGNPVSLTTTTGPDGTYLFPNLPPGTYSIFEVQPAGFTDSPLGPGTQILNVVLVNGDSKLDNDFGEIQHTETTTSLTSATSTPTPAAELGGRVYVDANLNGVDDGEVPIPGVTVNLVGTDDLGNPVSLTTTTGPDGTYLFPNLRPGTYDVIEVQPAGFTDSPLGPGTQILGVVLLNGDSKLDNDFGEIQMTQTTSSLTSGTSTPTPAAELGGRVYVDSNLNGVDDGETGIPGVTVNLVGTDDLGNPVSLTTTTGPDGTYLFPNLPPGTYSIFEVQPAGFTDSPLGPGTQILNVVLVNGDSKLDNDFGEIQHTETTTSLTSATSTPTPAAELGGRVYVDANLNGVDDGEVPIPGVTVNLVGTDDLGNPVSLTTTTGPDGTYLFPNLRPGTYDVIEVQPAGFTDSPLGPGTQILGVVLLNGDSKLDNDFGEIQMTQTTSSLTSGTSTPTPAAELGGRVYVDSNLNGVDDGETGIPGVTVNLVGTDDLGNPVSLTTTTGPDGTYLFPNLPPGTYSIFEVQPAGFTDSPLGPGTQILNVVLVNGDSKLDNDFGEIQHTETTTSLTSATSTPTPAAELGGRVYVDANLNGVDDGEVPIPGVTVNLVGTDDLGNPVSLTTTTGPDGTYLFPNLRPGTYDVIEVQPAGFTDSPLGPGTQILGVVLLNGDSKLDNDFGEIQMTQTTSSLTSGTSTPTPAAELGGRVYVDSNLNGVDDGETGIPGVTVNLVGTDDLGNPVSLTTTTGPDGTYLFPNLPPGTYSIFEVQPAGFTDSPLGPGTQILNVVLVNGDSKLDNDFGEIQHTETTTSLTSATSTPTPAAELGGRVYVDANLNGVDDGEVPIPGVTVNLVGTDDLGNPVSLTTTTGPDGTYLFPNLRPGTYDVIEVQPAGFTDSPLGPGTQILGVVLLNGDSKLDNDFGEIQMTQTTSSLTSGTSTPTPAAELGGRVYVDSNLNGVDDGETGIPGVTVNLVGTDDLGNPVSLTTTTGPDGTYLFPNLPPGTYSIFEVQPAGFTDSPLGPGTQILNVVLVNGDSKLDNDFGEIQHTETTTSLTSATSTPTPAAELGGRVYVDANLNGVDDGEVPIPGVTVNLVGTDDLGNPVSLTTTTGPDGTYLFPNLRPGTYDVIEVQPAGFTDSPLGPGTQILGVVLLNGDSKLDNDFGEIQMTQTTSSLTSGTSTPTPAAELGGRVYVDSNLNGVDDGETGIPGVTVNLVGTDDLGNPVSLTTTTGPDGTYLFPNLPPGTYSIFEVQPAGFTDSPLGPGTQILNVVLVNGDSKLDNDFGEIQHTETTTSLTSATSTPTPAAELGGRVYVDANLNGVDDGEVPIPGVTVNLVGTDDLGNPVSLTTTTGPDGTYLFPNLRPGTYDVIEVQPAGFTDSPLGPGTQILGVVLLNGDSKLDNDFGEIQMTSTTSSLTSTSVTTETLTTTSESATSSTTSESITSSTSLTISLTTETQTTETATSSTTSESFTSSTTSESATPSTTSESLTTETPSSTSKTLTTETPSSTSETLTTETPSTSSTTSESATSSTTSESLTSSTSLTISLTTETQTTETATSSTTSESFTSSTTSESATPSTTSESLTTETPSSTSKTLTTETPSSTSETLTTETPSTSSTTSESATSSTTSESLTSSTSLTISLTTETQTTETATSSTTSESFTSSTTSESATPSTTSESLTTETPSSTSETLTTETPSSTSETLTTETPSSTSETLTTETPSSTSETLTTETPSSTSETLTTETPSSTSETLTTETPSSTSETLTTETSTSETVTTETLTTETVTAESLTTETLTTETTSSRTTSETPTTTTETETPTTTSETRTSSTSTNTPAAEIGGRVYVDWNENGVDDSETGISGCVINVVGINDLGQLVNRTVITKPDGSWIITNLRQPAGASNSPLGPQEEILGVVLLNGDSKLDNDFGETDADEQHEQHEPDQHFQDGHAYHLLEDADDALLDHFFHEEHFPNGNWHGNFDEDEFYVADEHDIAVAHDDREFDGHQVANAHFDDES
ncbi:hypothetical protein DFJ74DRAFT_727665 [Hyaloraphidium curvatum]|nr:hypothetical protein DFJ74DRAFT_727665 [Hyaloraphidium curvatum]